MTGDGDIGDGENAGATGVEQLHLGVRILGRSLPVPPHMSESGDAIGGVRQRRDVPSRMPGGSRISDRSLTMPGSTTTVTAPSRINPTVLATPRW
jgi:hypothetical protein